MKIFSFYYPIAKAKNAEAAISKLNHLPRPSSHYGFYFHYRTANARHWLEPEYPEATTRRLPITIEVLFKENPEGVQIRLYFKIATILKVAALSAAVLYLTIFLYLWLFRYDLLDAKQWLLLFFPIISFIFIWAQFSGEVKVYIKAFKEAWASEA